MLAVARRSPHESRTVSSVRVGSAVFVLGSNRLDLQRRALQTHSSLQARRPHGPLRYICLEAFLPDLTACSQKSGASGSREESFDSLVQAMVVLPSGLHIKE